VWFKFLILANILLKFARVRGRHQGCRAFPNASGKKIMYRNSNMNST
jgi:hypothetical protein